MTPLQSSAAPPTDHVASCDLIRQTEALEPELMAAVTRVLRSGRYILGQEEESFTTELAHLLGSEHAVGVASGTDALVLALKAAGLRPGGKVLTTPFSFFATSEAIVLAGGTPVFCDIDPNTFNIDPAAVEAVLRGTSLVHRRLGVDPDDIQAIVPVHLFGHPAQTLALRALADARGLVLVEDAAQAMGAREQGRSVGTIGHAGCFSFFPSKNLGGFGDGGAVVTDDPAIAGAVTALRAHGATAPHQHAKIGLNSRLDELHAALLRVKLPRLETWVNQRRSHATAYDVALSGISWLTIPTDCSGGGHSYGQYTVRVQGADRQSLLAHLRAEGIGASVYYPRPIHLQPAMSHLGYGVGDFPITEEASATVLSLPMFPELTPVELERVATAIRRFVP